MRSLLLLVTIGQTTSRILTFSDSSFKPGDGCVRIAASTHVDMSLPACGGYQCPRCFILSGAVVTDQIERLRIHNCHAAIVYPPDKSGPYPLASNQMIEYTFVIDVSDRNPIPLNWIIETEDHQSAATSILLSNKYMKSVNVFCFNGKFL